MKHLSPGAFAFADPSKAPRSIALVRADVSDPRALFTELNKAVKEMRDEYDGQLSALKKDVVSAEKVDRINASIGELQAAIDDLVRKQEALKAGAGSGRNLRDPDYSKAFAQFFRRGESHDIQAALNKGAAADGGNFTPTEWDRSILDRLVLVSPMRQICRVQPFRGNAFSKLFNNHGAASGWVGETTARTETAAAQTGSLTYGVGEIYANPSATQQLLDDAEIDAEAWLGGEVQQKFAAEEGLAFISGSGANNRPNGILTYVTGGANAAAHPWGAITTVNSGAAAAFTADGIINLVHALPSAYTPNARFGMNRASHGLVRLLKDTTNNYLWQPSYAAGQPATLAGYPVIELPDMPAVAASAKALLFGDFNEAYLIVDGIGIRVLRDPFTAKPYVLFYTTKRVGGGLLNPDAMKAQNISV